MLGLILVYAGSVEHFVFRRNKVQFMIFVLFCIGCLKYVHFYQNFKEFGVYGDCLAMCMVSLFGLRWPDAEKTMLFQVLTFKASKMIFIIGLLDFLLFGRLFCAPAAFLISAVFYYTVFKVLRVVLFFENLFEKSVLKVTQNCSHVQKFSAFATPKLVIFFSFRTKFGF